jgi:hypothetical protein
MTKLSQKLTKICTGVMIVGTFLVSPTFADNGPSKISWEKFQTVIRTVCLEQYPKGAFRKAGYGAYELADACVSGSNFVHELPTWAFDSFKENQDGQWDVNTHCMIAGEGDYSYGDIIYRKIEKARACKFGTSAHIQLLDIY